ncbi:uncharacterized protein GGS22DRAFT_125716 [Annulohypoxylon maeteangense]|uniref:uncharacterized protein n=1 Tax=Annulohypoxylon maeteangense TaxID=1927788 RepID=UPI002008AC97|nr:uncharacterized protein GGS22DRAFT_125716 [Annulohypoxylon maeteangense]KAI0886201.1 hypothetical protein GGS22DRAFT_125716 [Annulohypoxylon maeteangense]
MCGWDNRIYPFRNNGLSYFPLLAILCNWPFYKLADAISMDFWHTSSDDEICQSKVAGSAQSSSAMPDTTEDPEWDTALVVTDEWMKVASERRHSGWESVERKWIESQALQKKGPKASSEMTKEANEAMARFPYPHMAIPTPQLDFDFRMRVVLNSQSASVAVSDGFKKWSTFSDGTFAGQFGCGSVVNGGQESQDVAYGNAAATQVEATHRLQTADKVPAYIECKTRGNMTGSPELVKALQDPETSKDANPRLCPFRVFITMKTSDERYASKLNTGMWIGSCLWRGLEVVYDAYRIS